jgi:hypothetical protein
MNATGNAELVWLPKRTFTVRDGVPLLLTTIDNNVIGMAPSFVMPRARALARPRIVSGATIPGVTLWRVSDTSGGTKNSLFRVDVRVDTSSAGFTDVPEYFATLQGTLTSVDGDTIQVLCLHFDHVEQPRVNEFLFSFFIAVIKSVPGQDFSFETQIPRFLNERKAYVSWLSIQQNPGLSVAFPDQ